MAIKKCCDNCSCHFPSIENCTKPCDMSSYCRNHNYDLCEFSEKAIREDCINDFKEIINNINIITNFDGIYENVIFNKAIEEYKKKLIERLEKYLKEK